MSVLVNPYQFAVGGGSFSSATITIASGKVGSNLSNFPVYLKLADMPSGFWSVVDSDGGNIRIKQSGSVIPFDIVKFDKVANTGTLFFKASSLLSASNNVFTLDLTGSGLLTATDTNGRNATWSAFDLVCMLEDASTYVDRTGGTAGTLSGTNTASSIALGAGCGLAMGSNANIIFSSRTARSVFTIAITANHNDSNTSSNRTALTYYNSSTVRGGLVLRNTTPDNYSLWDNSNSWISAATGATLSSGASFRLHGVYNGSTERKFYYNGGNATTDAPITTRSVDNTYRIGLAANGSESFGANGSLAFAYARPEVLSADYIAAEYSNLNAPSSFYTIT